MKKLTLLFALIAPAVCFAQTTAGIKFNSDAKWTDLLAQAKATHKLIFVDVYTTWCGPCKEMDATIFPMQNVGDLYNNSFITAKIDAEKGEGIDIKKQYKVESYPNYLFVDGEGVLIYRSGGSMPANEFIKEGKNALLEAKEPQTIVQQEAMYPQHKTNKAFMYSYLTHLTKLRLPTEPMLDDYEAMLSKNEQGDAKNIQLIVDNGLFINKKVRLGIAIDILKQNKTVFDSLKSNGNIKETIAIIENNAMQVTMAEAIQTKNDELFKKVQALKRNRKDNSFNNSQTLAINYYYSTGNIEQFKKEAKNYLDFLLQIPMDTLKKWDDDTYFTEKAYYEKQNDPKFNNRDYIYTYRHTQTIQLVNQLSDLSERMMEFKLSNDELKLTKNWATKALAIANTDKEYYRSGYPVYQKNHALALYKSNQKQAAIAELKKSIASLSEDAPHEHGAMVALLAKMQHNEKI